MSCISCIAILYFLGTTNPPVPVQQRVQILRGPDGKLQVRGLLPGQQLVQMPDGKLHVLNVSQTVGTSIAQGAQTNSTTSTITPQVIYLKKHIFQKHSNIHPLYRKDTYKNKMLNQYNI